MRIWTPDEVREHQVQKHSEYPDRETFAVEVNRHTVYVDEAGCVMLADREHGYVATITDVHRLADALLAAREAVALAEALPAHLAVFEDRDREWQERHLRDHHKLDSLSYGSLVFQHEDAHAEVTA